MKRFISILIFCILAIISVFPLFSCSNESGNPPKNEGIKLNKTQLQTLIGDTNMLSVKSESIDLGDVVWTTENAEVATVTDGLVESISVGKTKIKATYGKYSAECEVNVSLGTKLPQLVIENEKSEYRIGKNEQNFPFETYVLFNGKKFYDANIEYSTTDSNIADFDSTGKLLISSAGKITASFSATWRGMDDETIPSLYKTVEIEIVEEVYFYVNGLQYDKIELSTLSEFEGENYTNQMNFVPSVSVNGTISSDVSVTVPEELLIKEGNSIRALSYGSGVILLNYNDGLGSEYQSTINLSVVRPETTYNKNLEYFSTYTGTFKDCENGYADTTIAKKILGEDCVEGFKASYEGKELQTENGKIFGMPNDYNGSYSAQLKIETDLVVYYVNVRVYGIVVQNAQDLKLFELNLINADDPTTYGIDETKITCIDGYCMLLNDIDATGVKIEHGIFDVTYPYVDKDGVSTSTTIDGVIKRYNASTTNASEYDHGTEKFGFIGKFNGNGYTIANLDLSVENGKTGGGLFGYLFGNAIIENVGFTELNISNSSGLCYSSSITSGRKMPVDKRGLRVNNTDISDIYIQLSASTVNPKGALMFNAKNTDYALLNLSNVIIDATAVELGGSISGGVVMNNGDIMCKPNKPDRFYCNDVYLISDEYPAYFDASTIVYGFNEANGEVLDSLSNGKIYTSKFSRYDSIEDMKNAELDYSSFTSSSWIIVEGYPIFKSAAGVYPCYNGEIAFDGKIKVNSMVDGKQLTLKTHTGQTVSVDGFTYNSSELKVDSNGYVTLASAITEIKEYSMTVQCTYNGKTKVINVKVLAYPSDYAISEAVEMSAYDGILNLEDYVQSPRSVISVKQTVNGESYNLTVKADGQIVGAQVVINADYSDVMVSELVLTTSDMEYKFTNVKVYSHIITEAADLAVFAHTKTTGRISGYYVLGRTINAKGYTLSHDETLFSSEGAYDNLHAFQGVFDGRGYAIMNFRPGESGLLGSVYSDAETRTVIKNVAFINVLTEKGKNFTIFGRYMESDGAALTELTNVHVDIAKTYLSEYNPTTNYKGLFNTNKSTYLNTFKFTNVYVVVNEEEDSENKLYLGHGSILTRDNVGVGVSANLTSRSSRFENVITITQMNPCVYRQFVGNSLTEEFDTQHMYVIYAENEVGKQGMRCTWLEEGSQYCHDPVSENGAIGSYLYNNVYRYDTVEEVETEKINKLVSTGMWKLVDGELSWAKMFSYQGTDEGIDFDTDWLVNA